MRFFHMLCILYAAEYIYVSGKKKENKSKIILKNLTNDENAMDKACDKYASSKQN